MALIVVAADKGAPGVTTTAVALGAVWPRPVLLAECDPSGGDLLYRLPAADGGRLDPRRGLLSLAVAARRGLLPDQVWGHAQKLHGGLDVLVGVAAAEQGAGLELLWGPVGRLLAALPQADVIADCGRLGVDGPVYDLLAHASSIVLLSGASLAEVVRLRERVASVTAALEKRGQPRVMINVVIVADYKDFKSVIADVGHALRQTAAHGRIIGGIAYEPKSAEQLRGEWSGRLDKSMFIRTARAIAADLAASLPAFPADNGRPAPAAGLPAVPGESPADTLRPGQPQPSPAAAPLGQAAAGAPRPPLGPPPSRSPLAGQPPLASQPSLAGQSPLASQPLASQPPLAGQSPLASQPSLAGQPPLASQPPLVGQPSPGQPSAPGQPPYPAPRHAAPPPAGQSAARPQPEPQPYPVPVDPSPPLEPLPEPAPDTAPGRPGGR